MIAPTRPLETERLTLRQFVAEDLVALHETHSDDAVVRWLYDVVRSLEETRALLHRKIAGGRLAREGEWQSELVYAILDREWRDAPRGERSSPSPAT